jgi:hypothetical protein
MRIGLPLALSLFALVSFMSFGAKALPIAPLAPAAAPDLLVEVRGGCGLGWHRGPLGGCRPNLWWNHAYWGEPRCWIRPNGRRACYW